MTTAATTDHLFPIRPARTPITGSVESNRVDRVIEVLGAIDVSCKEDHFAVRHDLEVGINDEIGTGVHLDRRRPSPRGILGHDQQTTRCLELGTRDQQTTIQLGHIGPATPRFQLLAPPTDPEIRRVQKLDSAADHEGANQPGPCRIGDRIGLFDAGLAKHLLN